MASEKQKGLFEKLKDAVDAAVLSGSKADAPRPRRSSSASLAKDAFLSTAGPGNTQELNKQPSTAELGSAGPPESQLSPRRLAMARDFARGDFKIPQMQDPAFMYKVVSDERAYQLRLLQERRKVLARIPKAHPKAGELQAKIAEGQETVRMLFGLLKRITGREGATGGTDFLPGSG